MPQLRTPRPSRALSEAQIDSLFAECLVGVQRIGSTHLRLVLLGDPSLREKVQSLTGWEADSGPFFAFRPEYLKDAGPGSVSVTADIIVIGKQSAVLAALADRAERLAGLDGAETAGGAAPVRR